jgi:hypothetical protein
MPQLRGNEPILGLNTTTTVNSTISGFGSYGDYTPLFHRSVEPTN